QRGARLVHPVYLSASAHLRGTRDQAHGRRELLHLQPWTQIRHRIVGTWSTRHFLYGNRRLGQRVLSLHLGTGALVAVDVVANPLVQPGLAILGLKEGADLVAAHDLEIMREA